MPKTVALPLVGRRWSSRTRIVVVFPAPFGPRKPNATASRPPDHAGAAEDASRPADRAPTRLKGLGDLGGGLFRWLADEQPAPHSSGHRGHPIGGQVLAHLLDEFALIWCHRKTILRSERSVNTECSASCGQIAL